MISPIVIQTAMCLSYGILIESALSYLGVGVQPPTPSGHVPLVRYRACSIRLRRGTGLDG